MLYIQIYIKFFVYYMEENKQNDFVSDNNKFMHHYSNIEPSLISIGPHDNQNDENTKST